MEGGCTCGHIRYRLNGRPLIWSDEAKGAPEDHAREGERGEEDVTFASKFMTSQ
jgi:hypothetical protein